tara:strand:+ start:75 stop:284 length:210 start_codon:yes stop_codon:yes gene_type:complete
MNTDTTYETRRLTRCDAKQIAACARNGSVAYAAAVYHVSSERAERIMHKYTVDADNDQGWRFAPRRARR